MRNLMLIAIATACVALATVAFSARTEVREITLVARGMAFYVDGQATANPVVYVRRGERVRIIVRNVTPGILHDLAIDSLNVATAPLNTGEVGWLDFTVADQTGVLRLLLPSARIDDARHAGLGRLGAY